MAVASGTRFGPYKILGVLGAGGMSARGHADALRRGGIGDRSRRGCRLRAFGASASLAEARCLREVAVLLAVFVPLDVYVQGGQLTVRTVLATIGVVALFLVVGLFLEVKQWKR